MNYKKIVRNVIIVISIILEIIDIGIFIKLNNLSNEDFLFGFVFYWGTFVWGIISIVILWIIYFLVLLTIKVFDKSIGIKKLLLSILLGIIILGLIVGLIKIIKFMIMILFKI